MKIVRDRADAEWIPSRFNFAIFRLLALLRMRRMTPRQQQGLVLVIDRNQNRLESTILAICAVIVGSCFAAAALWERVPHAVAIALALPIVLAIFSALIPGIGVVLMMFMTPRRETIEVFSRITGLVILTLMVIPAAYFIVQRSWARPVAIAFLAALAANVLASVMLMMLRSRIREVEARYGVSG